MAKYYVKYDDLQNQASSLQNISKTLSSYEGKLNSILNALDTRDSGLAAMGEQLKTCAKNTEVISDKLSVYGSTLNLINARYSEAERTKSNELSLVDVSKIAASVANIVAKSKSSGYKSGEITTGKINNLPIEKENEVTTSTSVDRLPDWAKKGNPLEGIIYGKDGKRIAKVSTWNDTGVRLSCAFYTLRKLRERGRGYPFVKAGVSGGQWYSNCSDDVEKFPGENGLQKLIDGHELPLKNIVVDMTGHVVLIDEIKKGADGKPIVIFSDMDPSINTKTGYNPTKTYTIEKFLASFTNQGKKINGFILIG